MTTATVPANAIARTPAAHTAHTLLQAYPITQDAINAAVDENAVTLYYALAETGMLPQDESQGTMQPYADAGAAMFAAIGQDRTLRDPALAWESASGDLASAMFDEGFRRGIAFMRAIAELQDTSWQEVIAPATAPYVA